MTSSALLDDGAVFSVDAAQPASSSIISSRELFEETAVSQILADIQPSEAYWDNADRVLEKVDKYVNDCLAEETEAGEIEVRPFGSFHQRTALVGSDVDVTLVFKDRTVNDIDFNEDVDDRCKATKNEKIRLLKRLAKELRDYSGSCTVKDCVWFAKIPIIKIEFDGCLEVDISIGKESSGRSDENIRKMLAQGDGAGAAVRSGFCLFKYWVRTRLALPEREKKPHGFFGMPSSFGWVILWLYFCVESGWIVPLEELERREREALPEGEEGEEEERYQESGPLDREDKEDREGPPGEAEDDDLEEGKDPKRRKVAGAASKASGVLSAPLLSVPAVSLSSVTMPKASSGVIDGSSPPIGTEEQGRSSGRGGQGSGVPEPLTLLESFLVFVKALETESDLRRSKFSIVSGKRLAVQPGDFNAETIWVEDPGL